MQASADAKLAASQHELQASNWSEAAFDAAVLRVKLLARVDTNRARALLDEARPLVAGLPASSRAQLWVAEAILRRAEGRHAAALRALQAGMQLLELHQASLGAAELRVRAGARIEQLAEIGASIELESRSPERVFMWLERGRAGGLAIVATLCGTPRRPTRW
jgi:phytoene/squalene synthetase